jgi:hypothetical protein
MRSSTARALGLLLLLLPDTYSKWGWGSILLEGKDSGHVLSHVNKDY